jgi:histidinol-phosphate/aromatic aminotransferase/cobyric acid decarboxylase-like protein
MHQLSALIPITPPWAVSLPAQVGAVRALADAAYYRDRYQETHGLRAQLIDGLRSIGIREIVPGTANFIMFHLEPDHPDAATVISRSNKGGVFLRDVACMGSGVGPRGLRIAVKNQAMNTLVVAALENALSTAAEAHLAS